MRLCSAALRDLGVDTYGELVVTVDGAETVLGWLDSVHLAKGELRSIHNRTDRQALLLVTVAHPVAEVA